MLKILVSLVLMFAIFSFANSSAMEKNEKDLGNKKQEEQKKEQRFSPVHVDLENGVIYLDFQEEDGYDVGKSDYRILRDVEKYLSDVDYGRNLNEYAELLPYYLKDRYWQCKREKDDALDENLSFDDISTQMSLNRIIDISGANAKEYEILYKLFENCTFDFAYDDLLTYQISGKFVGRTMITMKDFNYDGLVFKNKLRNLLT